MSGPSSAPGQNPAALPVGLLVWAVLATAVDVGIARLAYGAVLPTMAKDLALSYTLAGVLSAVNLAAYLVGTLIAPMLGRWVGMAWLGCGGHVAMAIGALLSGIAQEPFVLGLGRLLMGVGAGVGLVALFVILFEQSVPSKRGLVSAIGWSGIGLGTMVTGLALTWILAASNWRYPSLIGALIVAAVAVRLRPSRIPPARTHAQVAALKHAPARNSLRQWAPLFGAYFMFGMAYISYATFAGARLAASHASPATMSLSWALFGFASTAGCAATAVLLTRRAARRLAFTAALACGAIGCAIAGLEMSWSAIAAAGFIGFGLAATPAIVTAYVRERTSDADYARMFSLATATFGIGQFVGPVLSGSAADRYGTIAVIFFAGSCYAISALMALVDAARSP